MLHNSPQDWSSESYRTTKTRKSYSYRNTIFSEVCYLSSGYHYSSDRKYDKLNQSDTSVAHENFQDFHFHFKNFHFDTVDRRHIYGLLHRWRELTVLGRGVSVCVSTFVVIKND